MLYFTTQNYNHFNFNGKMIEKMFGDGEVYHRLEDPKLVFGKEVALIGGITKDADVFNLYSQAYLLIASGCSRLKLVIPYLAYSTMERPIKQGEAVKAKYLATLLSSLPRPPEGLFLYLVDLHSEGIPYYFDSNLYVKHLYAKEIIIKIIQDIPEIEYVEGSLNYSKGKVLASTDGGRVKWVESLARDAGLDCAFILKRRLENSVETSFKCSNVCGKDVIIYDDIIRSGGSIINAAQEYRKEGARRIFVVCTHGVFNAGCVEKLKDFGVEGIYTTDSHPNALLEQSSFVKVYSIRDLLFRET